MSSRTRGAKLALISVVPEIARLAAGSPQYTDLAELERDAKAYLGPEWRLDGGKANGVPPPLGRQCNISAALSARCCSIFTRYWTFKSSSLVYLRVLIVASFRAYGLLPGGALSAATGVGFRGPCGGSVGQHLSPVRIGQSLWRNSWKVRRRKRSIALFGGIHLPFQTG